MVNELYLEFEKLINNFSDLDKQKIQKALENAKNAHNGQLRKGGEEYITHPIKTSINLRNKYKDVNLLIAGLLHDTVEDNVNFHIKDIYETYGDEVGFLVDSVTKNKEHYYNDTLNFEKKMDKFLYGGMKNIKCFLLKLADRSDNLETLSNLKEHKQRRIAFETQAIFAPLMSLIGYNQDYTIEECQNRFNEKLEKNNITNYSELKKFLINKTYHDLDICDFDAIYGNYGDTIWKIEHEEVLNEILEIPDINDKIEIIDIEHNSTGKFIINFKFIKTQLFNNKKIKITYSDTHL